MATLRISRRHLRRAGERAVQLVVQRTQEGTDRHGADFQPYSTTPFAMPAGGGAHGALKRLVDNDEASFFETKKGALWAVVEGGYAAYKAERYGQDGGAVNLTATGSMLRSLQVVSVQQSATSGQVTVGFARIEDAEKAYYHSVAGAGPGKTIRDFMGLTDAEEEIVAQEVAEGLTIAF